MKRGPLTLIGFAPILINSIVDQVFPSVGSMAIAGNTPELLISLHCIPISGMASLIGIAPIFNSGIFTATGSSLLISGISPIISMGIISNTGSLAITGSPPIQLLTMSIIAGAGSVSIAGIAPIFDRGIITSSGSLILSGVDPSINIGIITDTGTLILTGISPVGLIPISITTSEGSLVLTGTVLDTSIGSSLIPDSGSLVITEIAPDIEAVLLIDYPITPDSGTLEIGSDNVVILISTSLVTGTGQLLFSSDIQSILQNNIITPPVNSLTISSSAGTISIDLPGSGLYGMGDETFAPLGNNFSPLVPIEQ